MSEWDSARALRAQTWVQGGQVLTMVLGLHMRICSKLPSRLAWG